MKQSASTLATRARHFLANAERLSREPDGIEKAGEMVWGALVCALKAVGAARGRRISRYRQVIGFARELVPGEMVAVGAAKGLHGQFYEGEVSEVLFRDVKGKVEVLVDDMLTKEGL